MLVCGWALFRPKAIAPVAWQGYAEADFVKVGPTQQGLVAAVYVARGDRVVKERGRGTMENLLAMPVRPIEVMIAKIAPYVAIGYIQVLLILVAASIFFALPIRESVPLLLGALGLFIACNLALGVTFSTVSANQMQAVQLAQFTLMPSFMLSGFMFPFRGMPVWAQVLGNLFPTTHAMRIVRGMLLKGNGWSEIAPELWPMALFAVVVIAFASFIYRETLD